MQAPGWRPPSSLSLTKETPLPRPLVLHICIPPMHFLSNNEGVLSKRQSNHTLLTAHSHFKVCWGGLSRQMHSFLPSLLPRSKHISPDFSATGAVCYAQTTSIFQENCLSLTHSHLHHTNFCWCLFKKLSRDRSSRGKVVFCWIPIETLTTPNMMFVLVNVGCHNKNTIDQVA